MRFLDRIDRATTRSIAISTVLEVRLEDRLQYDLGGGLNDPAADSGNSERTLTSPWLRDHHPPHRIGPVRLRNEFLTQARQPRIHAQARLPPKPWSGRGRRPCNVQRDDQHRPVSIKDLALSLGKKAWRSVTWREGSNAPLASRFAAVRVHPAARDYKRTTPHPVEWLLVEWPKGEAASTKYWLSTLPEDTPLATLVDYAKLRWRIERDYEELKGELGLSHYEGRGWRGFHHHATLCIAAYGF